MSYTIKSWIFSLNFELVMNVYIYKKQWPFISTDDKYQKIGLSPTQILS